MKKFFTAIGWAFLFLLLYLAVQVVVSVVVTVVVIAGHPELMSESPAIMLAQLKEMVLSYASLMIGLYAVILIPVIFLFKPSGQTRKEGYGLRWMGFKTLLSVIALAFGLYALVSVGMALIPWPDSWMNLHDSATGSAMSGSFWVNLVCVALLGPLMEELLFRGAIYGALRKGMPTVVALVLQAALFGLIHLNPVQFAYAFVLGLCLGLVYERTKSLWTAVAAHVLFNGISVVFTEVGEARVTQWLSQPGVGFSVLTGCAVLGILGVLGVIIFNRKSVAKPIAQ